jgi:hypothetical protein
MPSFPMCVKVAFSPSCALGTRNKRFSMPFPANLSVFW